MNEGSHQRIKTNGIWLHIAVRGTGPLVLLLHGFPEIWYSWRHQITFLANHGCHVVAPDLRGYGDSDSPLSPSSYTIMHLVGDIIGLLDHFGEQQLLLEWRIIDYLRTPSWLPPWITEVELQVCADEFRESGFTGAFNYYRAMDWNWELTAPKQGSRITVPEKFMVGENDLGFETSGVRQYVQGTVVQSLVPNLEIVILDGHHFLQQEKHQKVSRGNSIVSSQISGGIVDFSGFSS